MIKKKSKNTDDEDNGFASWGGYMAAKKAKLEAQFQLQVGKEDGLKSNIFKGISIFVNGYTTPTADELKRLMLLHGGVYHHYERNSTTHIIASNLPDCKVKQLKTLNVVKPSWIVDSLNAGSLLDYKKYLLYSNHTKSQPRLQFPQREVSALGKQWNAPICVEAHEETSDKIRESVEGKSSKDCFPYSEMALNSQHSRISSQIRRKCEDVEVDRRAVSRQLRRERGSGEKTLECAEAESLSHDNCLSNLKSVPVMLPMCKLSPYQELESNFTSLEPLAVEGRSILEDHVQKVDVSENTLKKVLTSSKDFSGVSGDVKKTPEKCSLPIDEKVFAKCGKTNTPCNVQLGMKNTPVYMKISESTLEVERITDECLQTGKYCCENSTSSSSAVDDCFLKLKANKNDDSHPCSLVSSASEEKNCAQDCFMVERNANITVESFGNVCTSFVVNEDKTCSNVSEDERQVPSRELVVNCSNLDRESSKNAEPKQDVFSHMRSPGTTKRTAAEPEFLSEFYGNSRLHHLSTVGAMFKEYVAKLRENNSGEFPGLKRLSEWKRKATLPVEEICDEDDLVEMEGVNSTDEECRARVIMHIDMDCFFVSVGLRKRPELLGHPVAVTHAKVNISRPREGVNRQFEKEFYQHRFEEKMRKHAGGFPVEEVKRKSRIDEVGDYDSLAEIASCNYEARNAGVRNGMFFGAAVKLCPNLKTIPYDFEGYKEVSYKLYDIVASYTLEIEAVSCDEMYVDCSRVLKETNCSALEFAAFLRNEIKEVSGCSASAGLGGNLLQARLATRKAKPNGQFELLSHDVRLFMKSIAVEDLPGVGHSLAHRLKVAGVTTCSDLQLLSLGSLQKLFGKKTGQLLFQHARGQDDRPLDLCHQRKSVSAEVNYGIRFSLQSEAEEFLCRLSGEVSKRLRQAHCKAKHITLKLMVRAKDAPVETAKFMGHGACDSVSRSTTVDTPTDDENVIYKEVVSLQRQLKVLPRDLRGVGIQTSRLVHSSATAERHNLLSRFLVPRKTAPKEKIVYEEQGRKEQREDKKKSDVCVSSGRKDPQEVDGGTSRKKREIAVSSGSPQAALLTDSEPKSRNVRERGETDLPLITPPFEVPILSLAQARKMVRAWVSREDSPEQCDVVAFAFHMQRLVFTRNLEEVDTLCCMMHRMILNRSAEWKIAYQSIVDYTQMMMQAVYGSDLKVSLFTS